MKRTEPEIIEASEFLAIFNTESERGAVLTAAAFLDGRLEEILRCFIADIPEAKSLFKGINAPLGTFAARTLMVYALALIDKNEFEDLTNIREIRNRFAHSWTEASFASDDVIKFCKKLPWQGPPELESDSNMRGRFSFAVAGMMVNLLWRARLASKERREIREWPNRA